MLGNLSVFKEQHQERESGLLRGDAEGPGERHSSREPGGWSPNPSRVWWPWGEGPASPLLPQLALPLNTVLPSLLSWALGNSRLLFFEPRTCQQSFLKCGPQATCANITEKEKRKCLSECTCLGPCRLTKSRGTGDLSC